MDRRLVGTEGNEHNDRTQGPQESGTTDDKTVDQRFLFRSQWPLAKEERDIGQVSSLTVKNSLSGVCAQADI
jgi:hypothetical protein